MGRTPIAIGLSACLCVSCGRGGPSDHGRVSDPGPGRSDAGSAGADRLRDADAAIPCPPTRCTCAAGAPLRCEVMDGATAGDAARPATVDAGPADSGWPGDGEPPDPHLDPAGDATAATPDLLDARVWLGPEELVVRLEFADDPLAGADASEVTLLFPHDGTHRREMLTIRRHGDGYSVRLISRSLGVDACSTVALVRGTIEVRLPAELFADVTLRTFSVAVGGDDAGEAPITLGSPRPMAARRACDPWGADWMRTSTVELADVAVAHDAGCGLTMAGDVACWGTTDALAPLSAPPAGPFESIGVSPDAAFACAMRPSGTIQCWGSDPPTFTGVFSSLGASVGCALTVDGDIQCAPQAGFAALSMTGPFIAADGLAVGACALGPAGEIACSFDTTIPQGPFADMLLASENGPCGLTAEGELRCEPMLASAPYRLEQIDGLDWNRGNVGPICGLTGSGDPVCFGAGGLAPYVAPGPFEHVHVSTTGSVICGIRADRRVTCWAGGGWLSPSTLPGGAWVP